MAALQTQWAWLLQLTSCLEVHLKHAAHYHQVNEGSLHNSAVRALNMIGNPISFQFYADVARAREFFDEKSRDMTSLQRRPEVSLDEGERLIRQMQETYDALDAHEHLLTSLMQRARDVVPLKARSQRQTQERRVTALCSYKQLNVSLHSFTVAKIQLKSIIKRAPFLVRLLDERCQGRRLPTA